MGGPRRREARRGLDRFRSARDDGVSLRRHRGRAPRRDRTRDRESRGAPDPLLRGFTLRDRGGGGGHALLEDRRRRIGGDSGCRGQSRGPGRSPSRRGLGDDRPHGLHHLHPSCNRGRPLGRGGGLGAHPRCTPPAGHGIARRNPLRRDDDAHLDHDRGRDPPHRKRGRDRPRNPRGRMENSPSSPRSPPPTSSPPAGQARRPWSR